MKEDWPCQSNPSLNAIKNNFPWCTKPWFWCGKLCKQSSDLGQEMIYDTYETRQPAAEFYLREGWRRRGRLDFHQRVKVNRRRRILGLLIVISQAMARLFCRERMMGLLCLRSKRFVLCVGSFSLTCTFLRILSIPAPVPVHHTTCYPLGNNICPRISSRCHERKYAL